jgi:hypothetical protein
VAQTESSKEIALMPFDALKRSDVVAPSHGGGGPRRIRTEIVGRRSQPRPRSHLGLLWWLSLALLLFAGVAAHAQTANWLSRTQGIDTQGGQWPGTGYRQGDTVYSDFVGPRGQRQHCRSWRVASRTFTDCH